MFRNLANKPQPLSVNEQALAHMQEKYGEPFTYAAPTGDSLTGTRQFYATCNSLPGKWVLVQVNDYKTDHKTFLDNYLAVQYESAVAEHFRSIGEEIFGEAIVHYEASNLSVSADLPADTSFEEYYADRSAYMIVTVEIKESNYSSRQQLEEMISQIQTSRGTVMVIGVVVPDALYGTLDYQGLNRLRIQKKQIDSVYLEISNGIIVTRWPEEG